MGLYDPALVFEHERGQESPFVWTGVHVIFVFMLIGALAINWYTLQAQHARWVEVSEEQRELLERQAAMAEESRAFTLKQEHDLDQRKQRADDLAKRSAELAEASDAVKGTIDSTSSAMEEMTESATLVSELVRAVVTMARQADEETTANPSGGRGAGGPEPADQRGGSSSSPRSPARRTSWP